MASLQPQNAPQGTFEHNLVVLVVILLLDGDNFLVHEEDVLVPILGVPLEGTLHLFVGFPSKRGREKMSFRVEVRSHV
jgi:hypothetical protein